MIDSDRASKLCADRFNPIVVNSLMGRLPVFFLRELEIAIEAIQHVREFDALHALDFAHIGYLEFFGTTGTSFLGNDGNLALVGQRQRNDLRIRPNVISRHYCPVNLRIDSIGYLTPAIAVCIWYP